MKAKTKVLIIGPSPTKSNGGMATVIGGQLSDKELNSKYDISMHASFVDGNKIWRVVYSIFAYLFFLRKYKKYDLFHIHVASYRSTFRKMLYYKKIKKANKKVLLHIHGGEYLLFYKNLDNKKKQEVEDFLKKADMVITLSDDWKEKFEETFRLDNCCSLNNGIDTELFKNAYCNVDDSRNSFVVLSRYGENKGTYDLIDAVEKIRNDYPDIKLYMAGDGEVEKAKSLVKDKKLEKNIIINGWAGFEKKISLLKKSATLILPSHNEGLPMSILEGMASGKAIISTAVGAIPEVITEENGILVKAGDIKMLSKAMIKCMTDVDMLKKMSVNNKRMIEEKYSLNRMSTRLLDYYRIVEEGKAYE